MASESADKRITVTLPKALASYVEGCVEDGFFVTESDVVRFAILELMTRPKAIDDRGESARFASQVQSGAVKIVERSTQSLRAERDAKLSRARRAG